MSQINKKGFFFAIDTLFASLVTVIGLVLILSSNLQISSLTQATYSAQDVMSQLATIRVNESANEYILELRYNGSIAAGDEYRTLLDTIGYFYIKNELHLANGTIGAVIEGILPENYNTLFLLNDTIIYERNIKEISQAEAPFVITNRRIILGVTNETNRFGPISLEVFIW
jgi:hypothetical protein